MSAGKLVLQDLKESNLIEKQVPHMHAVGHCYRCKTITEPLSTPQWYVSVQSIAQDGDKGGQRRAYPDHSEIMGEYLFCLDGRYKRLVHLPSDMVGTQDPCLVLSGHAE